MFLFYFIGSSSRFNTRREYPCPASDVVQDPPFSAQCRKRENAQPQEAATTTTYQPPPLPTTSEIECSAPFQRLWASCGCCCCYHHPFSLPTAEIEHAHSFSAVAGFLWLLPPCITTEIECFSLILVVVCFIGHPYQPPPQPLTTAENNRACRFYFSGCCHQQLKSSAHARFWRLVASPGGQQPHNPEIEPSCSFLVVVDFLWPPTSTPNQSTTAP